MLAVWLLSSTLIATSGWRTHGPLPASISSLALDADGVTVYAAAFDGRARLFRSHDSGETWTEITGDLLQDPIAAHLSSDPSRAGVLYEWRGACFGSLCYCCFAELRKSEDGGDTWENVPDIPGAVGGVTVAIDDPAKLYAWFFEYRMPPISMSPENFNMTTRDAGLSWSPVNLPAGGFTVFPDAVLSSRLYGVGPEVVVSLDAGLDWTPSHRGLEGRTFHSFAVDRTGDVLYIGTDSGVYRSTDSAATWAPTALTVVADALAVDPRSSRSIFAGTAEGVFHSSDGGENWTAMNSGLSNLIVTSLVIDPGRGVLHAGTQAGVFEAPIPRAPRILPPR
jgi:hypothetical protein